MASESPALRQAVALNAALDAIEACLDALAPGADPDLVAAVLAEPVRAFDAAAKEACP